MKVKELIERLEKFDGELELESWQNGDEYVSDLEFLKIYEEGGKVILRD